MQRNSRIWPLIEIVAMATLLVSYIWWWEWSFEGSFTLVVTLYFVIGLAAHLRAGEGPADIGLRFDTLLPAGRDALISTFAIGCVLVAAGYLLGSHRFPPIPHWPRALRVGITWGTMQQYGLLAIFFQRFRELLPGRRAPLLAAAGTFALLHLPNPFLMLVTFSAGALACWIYRRSPNLIVIGIMHGVISFLISATLPVSLTMGMRVGPRYCHFMGWW